MNGGRKDSWTWWHTSRSIEKSAISSYCNATLHRVIEFHYALCCRLELKLSYPVNFHIQMYLWPGSKTPIRFTKLLNTDLSLMVVYKSWSSVDWRKTTWLSSPAKPKPTLMSSPSVKVSQLDRTMGNRTVASAVLSHDITVCYHLFVEQHQCFSIWKVLRPDPNIW